MKKGNKVKWNTLALIVLSLLLITVTIYAVTKETDKIASKDPEKIYVGYDDGKVLENFTKEDAVLSMRNVLLSIKEDVDGSERTIEERMKSLDDGKVDLEDVINKKTLEKVYLHDDFKKVEFNRQFTASALLTYYQLINEDGEINPAMDFVDEMVDLDTKMKVAHIPLDMFIGDNRGIAFEMQYIDGEWKYNPYTSMMSLVMIVNYEQQIKEMNK